MARYRDATTPRDPSTSPRLLAWRLLGLAFVALGILGAILPLTTIGPGIPVAVVGVVLVIVSAWLWRRPE